MTRDPHLNPKQWHHGYVGIVLGTVGLGTLLGALAVILSTDDLALVRIAFRLSVGCVITIAIGVWLAIDDTYQHRRQHTHPGYRSPVNKLWGKILRKVKR